MPDFGITEIAALASIIGGATATGTSLYSLASAPGAPKPPDTTAQDAAAKAQAATTEKEAIARQAPDLQSQLGGAVAPDYYADLAAKNAGYAGDTNQSREALSSLFSNGTSPTSPQGTAPGPGGKSIFEDLLSQHGGRSGEGELAATGGFTGA